ncbi:class I SAM-dependent methyltransferase [Oceanirhabdus seepicola]|uniref:Class I SAM-dependent methyltransferase n=1 Tax=Oceanirhabdus seepicola TaxID=2828781 RepID=A0A9J6NYE9_9CLOT|nr:class I SAM-dependent methyltransferase [Oceanirhabdus seepicola]MCM1988168.1 class I SAM-dependent methyltransferase [Oceanirhabdus seepicola]
MFIKEKVYYFETQALICEQDLCNAKLIQMDAEKLDFFDNSFDNVLCGLSTSFIESMEYKDAHGIRFDAEVLFRIA